MIESLAISLRFLTLRGEPAKAVCVTVLWDPGQAPLWAAGIKKGTPGVPVVVQWLTNPTRNHEVAGSVPALAQWVNDPALPPAVV